MDRLEFLKEMKNSLVKTVKYAFAPIVDEKLDKIDRSLDVLSQLKWLLISRNVNEKNSIDTKFMEGQTIVVIHANGTIRAINGSCHKCNHLLYVSQADLTCKCMNCDDSFDLTGNNELQDYPIKKLEDGYYVGIPKKEL